MKSLSTYIVEALKKVGEYRSKNMKFYDCDIIQILDRDFKEGVSDRDFENYIKKDIDECFKLKIDDKRIDKVRLNLNPISGFASKVVIDGSVKMHDQMSWSSSTLKELVRWFDTFGYHDRDGKEINLRDGVVGWVITYNAVPGTKEPKKSEAELQLKLNKETEKLVDEYNRQHGQAVADYYGSKKTGEYTGD